MYNEAHNDAYLHGIIHAIKYSLSNLLMRILEVAPETANIQLPNGETPLTMALSCDELISDILLEHGTSANLANRYGIFPFHIALDFDGWSVLPRILSQTDISLFETAQERHQILHAAFWGTESIYHCKRRRLLKTKTLLGTTLLMITIQQGHTGLARHILKCKPKIDQKDWRERTALSYAVEMGNNELSRLLLSLGANPVSIDCHQESPLSYAIYSNNIYLVDHLLNYALKQRLSIGICEHLIYSAMYCKNKTIATNVFNFIGKPLPEVISNVLRRSKELIPLETVEIVRQHISLLGPFEALCLGEDTTALSLLKEKLISDPNNKDLWGQNLLILASLLGKTEIVRTLIEANWNMNEVDIENNNALLVAQPFPEVLRLLLRAGVDPNHCNIHGLYPFMRLPFDWSKEIVLEMIEKGADINAQDDEGRTLLMLSAQYNSTHLIESLVELNARIDIKCIHGKSALTYALEEGNKEATKILMHATQKNGVPLSILDNSLLKCWHFSID